MKAFLINPTAQTITPFDFSGKMEDLADILHVHSQNDWGGMAINDNATTPDVLFVRHAPSKDTGFFLINGILMPIQDTAVLLGMEERVVRGDTSGGVPRDVSTTAEWLQANIGWLKVLRMDDDDEDSPAFEVQGTEEHKAHMAAAVIAMAKETRGTEVSVSHRLADGSPIVASRLN